LQMPLSFSASSHGAEAPDGLPLETFVALVLPIGPVMGPQVYSSRLRVEDCLGVAQIISSSPDSALHGVQPGLSR
jgi:hypothetical protein